jgi:hypothetical protein
MSEIEFVALLAILNAARGCFDLKAKTTRPLGFELTGSQAQMLSFSMMTNLNPVFLVHVASGLNGEVLRRL